MEHGGCIYVLANRHHTVFYTGVTSDVYSRIVEHKEKVFPFSFTSKYNIDKLVYYETFLSIEEAIAREKQFKKYPRAKKMEIIRKLNPDLNDLFETIAKW